MNFGPDLFFLYERVKKLDKEIQSCFDENKKKSLLKEKQEIKNEIRMVRDLYLYR